MENYPAALINAWQTSQLAQSLSVRTVTERMFVVRRMATDVRRAPQLVTVEQIVTWLASGDWAPRTRWTYFGALAAWFRWLQTQGYREDNPMQNLARPRRPRSEPRPVSDENLRRLLSIRMHRRTRAMLLLASLQGLRVHEIAKLRADHLDLSARSMVVNGKGCVIATLPLHALVIEHAQQMPAEGYWFPGSDRGHQRRQSVSNTIKCAMKRAGVPGSAHSLRHWFGTALVAADVDLRTTQTLMRHQNLTSTAIYTLVADERRVEGINRLDPFKGTRL